MEGIQGRASMGPRLGRVEYSVCGTWRCWGMHGFNGATLRTRGILVNDLVSRRHSDASMGPRLGRVEYVA